MLDRIVTEIEKLVKEMNKIEELMKHNIYMRSIATNGLVDNKTIDELDLGDYVMNLHTEFKVLSARHKKLDDILRGFFMHTYMEE